MDYFYSTFMVGLFVILELDITISHLLSLQWKIVQGILQKFTFVFYKRSLNWHEGEYWQNLCVNSSFITWKGDKLQSSSLNLAKKLAKIKGSFQIQQDVSVWWLAKWQISNDLGWKTSDYHQEESVKLFLTFSLLLFQDYLTSRQYKEWKQY